jgi:Transposase DDE domain
MELPTAIEEEWPFLLTLLPPGWETAARELHAFQRSREIRGPADLLRLALVYGYAGLSLRNTTLWAREAAVANLSAPALFKRLCHAADWLGRLVLDLLAQRAAWSPPPDGLRLRLIDATALSRPGSAGTDFRVHVGLDLRTLTFDAVEVTTEAEGETLQRVAIQPGDLLLGDAGYARRPGIAAVVAAGGHVLVRHHWHDVPLQHPDGKPFDLWAALREVGPTAVGEWAVQTAPGGTGHAPAIPGRLIVLRKSPQACETARRKVWQQAKKHGRTPRAETLLAAEYVMLFLTLPASRLAAAAVLELYRFRWQVELAFKRLKSLLHLDELTAQGPDLCRTFLFAKLLGALLIDDLSHRAVDFSPWGYGSPAPPVGVAGV